MRGNGSRAALVSAAIAMAVTVAGCGSGASRDDTVTVGGDSGPAVTAAPVPVALHLSAGRRAVSAAASTISGTAANGASVSVDGREVAVHHGRWHYRVRLRIGRNSIDVEATMHGRASTTRVIHIVRHHSAAELEARARARALRAEIRRRHEAQAREHREQAARERKERETVQQQSECPAGTYENSAGNIVCKPYESPTQPAGATARCVDGTYSFSESRSGTCSHHGGVAVWLDE